jgi:hypothetical protein
MPMKNLPHPGLTARQDCIERTAEEVTFDQAERP